MLSGYEYTQLEKDALNLLVDYGFIEFPIDSFELASKAFNAKIVKYSSLSKEKLAAIKKSGEVLEDGFTIFEHLSNGNINYIIYYNDNRCENRQRYTISHEMKHILYGEEFPNAKDEEGAEYFAKVLIAPKCLVILKKIKRPEDIVKHFKLSHESSIYHMDGIKNRIAAFGEELFEFEIEFLNHCKEIKNSK